ncbi:glycosyltransferase [Thalassiella azotivora]
MIWLCAVSYFGSATVDGLVESLRAQGHQAWRLVLVDNSSDPDEAHRLRGVAERDERVSVLEAGENLGYLGGARYALDRVTLDDGDWFVVANTDLELGDGALDALAGVDDPDVGVVAPRILDVRSGRDSNPYWLHRPTRRRLLKARLAFSTVTTARLAVALAVVGRRRTSPPTEHVEGDLYGAHGSFMAFSSRYFSAGGTLDFPLFLFGEEMFVAEECRRLGLRTRYLPTMRVRHAGHESTGVWRSREVLRHQMRAVRYCYELAADRSTAG